MTHIKFTASTRTLHVDGVRIDPKRSQTVWNHSPDGFNIGYGGSGPAQTALGILLEVTNDEELSIKLHQDFKWDFVANWPMMVNVNKEIDVQGWLDMKAEQLRHDR